MKIRTKSNGTEEQPKRNVGNNQAERGKDYAPKSVEKNRERLYKFLHTDCGCGTTLASPVVDVRGIVAELP